MLEWLVSLNATLKVGCTFLGILLAYRGGVPLGLSITGNAVLLTLWTGIGGSGLQYQVAAFIQTENLLLLAVILFLLFFIESLGTTGRVDRTVASLKEWMRSTRILLAGLPALIGLLPMPGGALFSAPLVASLDKDENLDPVHKVAINYWFRHIWEYWWPLYPGVVLALKYSGLPIALFFLIHIPFTAVSSAAGYFFMLKNLPEQKMAAQTARFDLGSVTLTLGPIALLVVISTVGSSVLSSYGHSRTLANLMAMFLGLVVATGLVLVGQPKALLSSLRILTDKNTWFLMTVVIGVQAFSAALKCPMDAGGSTLVSHMRDEFIAMGIPLIIVKMIIPFISGVVTGLSMGFVGASFPLVFALLGPHPGLNEIAATTTLAYGFGFMGMMLSPVHICFLVTNEYFKTRLLHAYRYLWGPAIVILFASLLLSGLYYLIL